MGRRRWNTVGKIFGLWPCYVRIKSLCVRELFVASFSSVMISSFLSVYRRVVLFASSANRCVTTVVRRSCFLEVFFLFFLDSGDVCLFLVCHLLCNNIPYFRLWEMHALSTNVPFLLFVICFCFCCHVHYCSVLLYSLAIIMNWWCDLLCLFSSAAVV